MGQSRSTLEANLVNYGANSAICGANFKGANLLRYEGTVIFVTWLHGHLVPKKSDRSTT